MSDKTIIMDGKAMNRAIARIAYEILEQNKGVDNLCLVGILTRGAQLAERIAARIAEVEKRQIDVGTLDITRFRDDKQMGSAVHTDKSKIDFSVVDKKMVLVDDVIYTGRSVRAAFDAIMERGRPQQLQLAVLVDRGHRELPIRADYIGKNLPTSREESVRVMVAEIDGGDCVYIEKTAT